MKVLVEGAGYNNAWIETQPMGGEMYAGRDLKVALNNQLVFMQTQRADGRLPGMVVGGQTLNPDYDMLQGYCFPDPAWKMYFWIGRDRQYLLKLYGTLEAHDSYLWATRNPKGDGLLETWCIWDTGEDSSTRFTTRHAPYRWPFDFPPIGSGLVGPQAPKNLQDLWDGPVPSPDQVMVPFASMDLMSYSYGGRNTLAKISRELRNGQEEYWRQSAEAVRQGLINGLWNADRHACFDLDRTGKPLDELTINNLRAMYQGIFTQKMADEFIRYHLLNPAEFWTAMPLPSIAVNSPLFRNTSENNWSGQPEGLTYQRAIRALEYYGHFAEVTLLGRKLIAALKRGGRFTQQFDPFTGRPTSQSDGYGPTLLALLQYSSRMDGVSLDVEHDQIWWSALADGGNDFTYTQRWGDRIWKLTSAKGKFTAQLNGRQLFSCTAGVRVVTDLNGTICGLIGIDSQPRRITLGAGNNQFQLTLAPNGVYGPDGHILQTAPFDYPYRHP